MESRQATRRVLIVEDDEPLAETLADMLADEGYQPVVSVDGDALDQARSQPPGLILLDVMMPGLDGTEVCRRLKADARTRQVPVVFLTVLSPEQVAARLGDCPYEAVIPKPYRLGQVLDAVHRYLD